MEIILIQIVDPDTFDVQFTELITLTTTDNAFLLEKTTDFTTLELGEFSNRNYYRWYKKSYIYTNREIYKRSHIKILKIDFNSDLSGIGTQAVGQRFRLDQT